MSLEMMRNQAVKAMRNGETVQSVANAYGVNIRTVFRWRAAFASGGQKALQAKPIPGRPAKLSAEQLSWLAAAVRSRTPQQYRFEFALWTLRLIEGRIGIRLSRSMVGRVMTTLDFTPHRPLYRAMQRDAVLVERWQKEEFPAVAAEAKRAGATLLFADKASIRSHYHAAGTTWAAMGNTPVVKTTGRRFLLTRLSVVSATGQFRFIIHEGSAAARSFLQFRQRLMHDAKRTIKRKDDLKAKAISALRRLQKLKKTVEGFFRHPDCRHIPDTELTL